MNCQLPNRKKRTNKIEVEYLVLSENEIVNEQVDVSCDSSLLICFMKE